MSSKKVSLVTACKNRNECLQAVLPSWLQKQEIKEIIVVDWSSTRLLNFLTNIDERIKVVRVENENYYIPSQANNLGVQFSTQEYILRIDVDHFLNPYYNFFDIYDIDETNFATGAPEDENDKKDDPFLKYLYGLLYVSRENYYKVNGYNESIGMYYSYEDGDIFNRLQLAGLTRIGRKSDDYSVIHIPHSNKKRYENFEGGQTEICDNEQATINYHYSLNSTIYQNPQDFFTISKINWFIEQKLNNYFIATKK